MEEGESIVSKSLTPCFPSSSYNSESSSNLFLASEEQLILRDPALASRLQSSVSMASRLRCSFGNNGKTCDEQRLFGGIEMSSSAGSCLTLLPN